MKFCPTVTTKAIVLLFLASILPASIVAQEVTVKVNSKGRDYIGRPLINTGSELVLQRRDGRINILPIKNRKSLKVVSRSFAPFEKDQIRQQLQKEFGGKYQVSVTRNFVVVHPPGDYQDWAMPFENLYQRFRNYFSSRGFTVGEPEFPMIAVVLRTYREFKKMTSIYPGMNRNVLGYYSQKSNRIITFDPTNGKRRNRGIQFEETLIHEAVHQTAFNTGIHERYAFTPKWTLEGLACMFEAKGVHNSIYYSTQEDRINKGRLASLKYFYSGNVAQGKLKKFITGDRYFKTNTPLAYAYSWGLTFFLAENYPTEFFNFIRADGTRDPFREFDAAARLSAFKKAFGSDLKGLEKRLERFIRNLRI